MTKEELKKKEKKLRRKIRRRGMKNKNSSIKDTLLFLESWENNFLETMAKKIVIEENIKWKKMNKYLIYQDSKNNNNERRWHCL